MSDETQVQNPGQQEVPASNPQPSPGNPDGQGVPEDAVVVTGSTSHPDQAQPVLETPVNIGGPNSPYDTANPVNAAAAKQRDQAAADQTGARRDWWRAPDGKKIQLSHVRYVDAPTEGSSKLVLHFSFGDTLEVQYSSYEAAKAAYDQFPESV